MCSRLNGKRSTPNCARHPPDRGNPSLTEKCWVFCAAPYSTYSERAHEAAVSESYDLIRFADNLSNPLYRSEDTIRGNLAATRPIQSIAIEDAMSSHRFKIGQSVNYTSGPFGVGSGSGVYKITQLLIKVLPNRMRG